MQATVHERDEVRGQVVAGIDAELAVVVVRLAALLAAAVTREVLEHVDDGLGTPALVLAGLVVGGLETGRKGVGHVAGERGILAKGVGDAAPARLARDVHLDAEQRGDALGTVGTSVLVRNAAHEVGVKARGEAERARETVVLGVVGDVHRDAVGLALDVLLELVDPAGEHGGAVGVTKVEHRTDAVVEDLLQRGVGVVALNGAGARKDVGDLAGVEDRAVQHEREGLVGRELVGKCRGTLVGTLAPVFPEVKLAVAVEVLEREAVDLDELVGARHAQRRATLVGHARPAVAHLLLGMLGRARPPLLCVDRVGIRRRHPRGVVRRGVSLAAAARKRHEGARGRRRLKEVATRHVLLHVSSSSARGPAHLRCAMHLFRAETLSACAEKDARASRAVLQRTQDALPLSQAAPAGEGRKRLVNRLR